MVITVPGIGPTSRPLAATGPPGPTPYREALGAYVNDDPRYLQSTGFVLAPDASVVTAVCSSGAIGRLVPGDVIGLVRYAKEHG